MEFEDEVQLISGGPGGRTRLTVSRETPEGDQLSRLSVLFEADEVEYDGNKFRLGYDGEWVALIDIVSNEKVTVSINNHLQKIDMTCSANGVVEKLRKMAESE